MGGINTCTVYTSEELSPEPRALKPVAVGRLIRIKLLLSSLLILLFATRISHIPIYIIILNDYVRVYEQGRPDSINVSL
jgi:hypothetical protein